MAEAPTSSTVYTKLQRIARQAADAPQMAFNNLAHLIDLEFLREAYRLTRKNKAPGVDHVTAVEYSKNLEGNLHNLLDRMKAGTYKAPPVKRVYIPKDDKGNTRPIGIPTFEDKVLQRAVAMVLGAIYERDFLDCSYGFRPGRSAHQALEDLRGTLMDLRGGWVLEVDIKGFFDAIDHAKLRDILDLRVRCSGIRRFIGKWMKAGVLEGNILSHPDVGSPQGGVISPLLANIYLNEVLDGWFERTVRPLLHGQARLIRFADDFVIVFDLEADARRVWAVLPKRFAKFGLTLHEEKSRLVSFGKPGGKTRPETFDFLGFTHYWGKAKGRWWVVIRKTARSRLRRAIAGIAKYCEENRHVPVKEQHRVLCLKIRGHMNYFGIAYNQRSLNRLLYHAKRTWRAWLNRRSQKAKMTWEKMERLTARYPLPRVCIFHRVGAAKL
jgi:group II intron reverse transcriptase/maturase